MNESSSDKQVSGGSEYAASLKDVTTSNEETQGSRNNQQSNKDETIDNNGKQKKSWTQVLQDRRRYCCETFTEEEIAYFSKKNFDAMNFFDKEYEKAC